MAACVGVLTVSDTRSRGEAEDLSGPALVDALEEFGFKDFLTEIVPDEVGAIQEAILRMCERCNAVFTTGGTGFSPRDVTPEATRPLLDRRADNLQELIRHRGLAHTPLSHLSRGVAGVRGHTLIVNLPGSPVAVWQGVEALAPLLPEILAALRGEACTHGASQEEHVG
jgi:molybdopterin adenylyltransferase